MNESIQNIINEWDDCNLIKIFEYPVINNRTNEGDWIIFDIQLNEDNLTFEASHIALNEEQSKSDNIPFVSIEIDECFSLDEHLQELESKCSDAIMKSDYFVLGNE